MPTTIHLVSHTHWDREWYLSFQQFRLKLVHMLDRLLDLFAADPSYAFFMLDGQTIILEDYLQMRPERESELRNLIASGKISIGPWYTMPDEFLISPEAILRNLLEGSRVAHQFGAQEMKIGYTPDPFGHIGQLPQILSGFGISNAALMRGLSDEPCELWWQSPDGSRVLLSYLRDGYGNAVGVLSSTFDYFTDQVKQINASLADHSHSSHSLLMFGTDHTEPSEKTPAAIAYANTRLDGNIVVHSTLSHYFDALHAIPDIQRMPTVTGELRSSKRTPLLPAVLSTRMWIKQRNQSCETLLERWAEPFSALAEKFAPQVYPGLALRHPEDALRQAWRILLTCHPHDSICGCSIDAVHDEMRPRFDQVEQIAQEITRQSLERLTSVIQTLSPAPAQADGTEIVAAITVFNPSQRKCTDGVNAAVEAHTSGKQLELVDEQGNLIPFETHGLGSQELINMEMKPRELESGLGMISDGIVMGLKIRSMQLNREGTHATLTFTLSEHGEPDLSAWEAGKNEIVASLQDSTITNYRVKATSAEATQIHFAAPDVPGMGYRTFWVRARSLPSRTASSLSFFTQMLLPVATRLQNNPQALAWVQRLQLDSATRPPYCIENEFLSVEAFSDGSLTVHDKTTDTLYPGQNRFVDGGDRGDEYNYSAPPQNPLSFTKLTSARVEKGAVSQSLILHLQLRTPAGLTLNRKARSAAMVNIPITCRVTLTNGAPRVDIHTEIENTARDHRLRVHFTAPFACKTADYDGHFDIIQRSLTLPTADESWVEQPVPEQPQRAFTTISDGKNNLLIANRGLPEVEVISHAAANSEIALTLLRCVGWLSRDDFPERKGHAGPGVETPGAQMPGHWAFDYAIVPHAQVQNVAAIHQAYAFQTPLRAEGSQLHPGSLPSQASLVKIEPDEFIFSSLKIAQEGQNTVIRGYNISTIPLIIRLKFLKPFQSESAHLCSLAEKPITNVLVDADGWYSFSCSSKGIRSLLLK